MEILEVEKKAGILTTVANHCFFANILIDLWKNECSFQTLVLSILISRVLFICE